MDESTHVASWIVHLFMVVEIERAGVMMQRRVSEVESWTQGDAKIQRRIHPRAEEAGAAVSHSYIE